MARNELLSNIQCDLDEIRLNVKTNFKSCLYKVVILIGELGRTTGIFFKHFRLIGSTFTSCTVYTHIYIYVKDSIFTVIPVICVKYDTHNNLYTPASVLYIFLISRLYI